MQITTLRWYIKKCYDLQLQYCNMDDDMRSEDHFTCSNPLHIPMKSVWKSVKLLWTNGTKLCKFVAHQFA